MGKLILLLCFAILAVTLTTACFHLGQICTSDADCCVGICHPCAGRCTGGPPPGIPIGPCSPKGPPV
ncbi:conotoxin Cal6.33-like [Cataglyphis hispanica]|uniref:conotoxin Cal6.33-like n=1 Tax=Cataglyphis hispanica TaxID=1086592 RepID=UPI00217F6354|nr:conotoxin Cal6.33-like [Cataglyphis hispanica]